MWVPSLGQEDSLEKEMATHSSVPAWEIQWTEDGISKELDMTRWLNNNKALAHCKFCAKYAEHKLSEFLCVCVGGEGAV